MFVSFTASVIQLLQQMLDVSSVGEHAIRLGSPEK